MKTRKDCILFSLITEKKRPCLCDLITFACIHLTQIPGTATFSNRWGDAIVLGGYLSSNELDSGLLSAF